MLGSKARDMVSGFDGTVVGEAKFLYSAARVLIEPHGLKDGLPITAVWFDAGRVEVLEARREVGFVMAPQA